MITVYTLIEDKWDHSTIGVFSTEDKARAAAESIAQRNPKKYRQRMAWEQKERQRWVYASEDDRRWFEVIPMVLNAYFNGTTWCSDRPGT